MPSLTQIHQCNPLRLQGSQRFRHTNGCWWLLHPADNRQIRLDYSLLGQCDWRVDRLCSYLGIGKRTFSRMIERDLDTKSKLWLRQERADCACDLLHGNDKIEHVAQVLGFRQLSDFDREFRKLMGVSPTFYRNSERSRSASAG